jgi:uncharacterized protein with HEPN domain
MKRDQTIYLQHILDGIDRIDQYLEGVDEKAFQQHYLIQDGVIRQLEIIGEAVRHISEELRETYAHIPWHDIAAMRDKLIHDYFGVDIDKVWLTACDDIPVFKKEVVKILSELKGHR